MSRVTETQVAHAVSMIAASNPDGICSFDQARAKVPNHLDLSQEDLTESTTRVGEVMWHQQIRNIQSHHDVEGNFICEGYLEHVDREGYRITDLGRSRLK
jgi:hypothetical protein